MVSGTALTVLFGYMAAVGCLQLLPEPGKKTHTTPPQSAFARLAAGAVLPAAVATFGLTSLLLCAYVSDAAAAAGAGAGRGRRRFVDRLANATAAAAATVALLLLAWLLADNVDWLNVE